MGIEEITGYLGEWLDNDLSDIPAEAVGYLQKAYEICVEKL